MSVESRIIIPAAALALAREMSRREREKSTWLTSTARDIGNTRDPSQRVPVPDTEDEVAELAETMDRRLQALEESARGPPSHCRWSDRRAGVGIRD